jgi:hypothetical protein
MIIDLPEGEHEYKFLVDGEWKVNPQEVKCIAFLVSVNLPIVAR